MLERSQSLLQYYNNIAKCKIGILRTMEAADSETPAQRQKQNQTVVSVDREHRDGCAS